MEITYHWEGDYLIPDLKTSEEEKGPESLGRYGRERERYLKDEKPFLFYQLMTTGKLRRHLLDVDEQAYEMVDSLMAEMKKKEGVTEKLKAEDMMAWVGKMENIRSRAEEIMRAELIYV